MAATKSTSFSETTNTSANTSNLTISIYFSPNNTQTWFASKTLYCSCNGQTQSANVTLNRGGSVSASFTFYNIAHNSDGTKSVSWSWSCATGTSVLGNIGDSGTRTLTRIPRASSFSVSGDTLGSNVSISISRASNSFTHTVVYRNFNGTNTTIATGATTSASFTPPVSDCQYIPNASSGTVTIIVYTYSGGTLIGSKSLSVALKVPTDIVPTIDSINLSEAVSVVSSQFNSYIQNQSRINGIVSASGVYNSTIKGYSIKINGETKNTGSFVTDVLKYSGENTCEVTVTDSRGKTATSSITFEVTPYNPPQINEFSVDRDANDQSVSLSEINVEVTELEGNNSTITLMYKKQSENIYSSVTVSNNFTYNDVYSLQISEDDSYDFKLRVTDYFGSTTKDYSIGTAFVLVNYGASGKAIGFGKVTELTEGFEFAEDIYYKGHELVDLLYPVGSILIYANDVDPNERLGGTWELTARGQCLVGSSENYTVGNTYGSATHTHTTGNHTLTTSQIPSHNHSGTTSAGGGHSHTLDRSSNSLPYGSTYDRPRGSGATGDAGYTTSSAGSHTHSFSTGYTGGGGAHNHGDTGAANSLPLSLCVNIWKRIS